MRSPPCSWRSCDSASGRGDELPAELQRRQERLRRIAAAREELEAEARAAHARSAAERGRTGEPPPDEPPPPSLPEHQVRHDARGAPAPDAQRNFTDPDSRVMKRGSEFVQAYNAQVVVDEAAQVIVATGVTNQAPDVQHLPAMVAAVVDNLGRAPVQLLADAGYHSAANHRFREQRGIDDLRSVAREKHVLDDTASPWPPNDPRARMHEHLRSVVGRAAYARRTCIVEPVFGQLKDARGIRAFLLRGIQQVRGEWNLVCLAHNLLKLFRYTRQSALVGA